MRDVASDIIAHEPNNQLNVLCNSKTEGEVGAEFSLSPQ